MSDTENGIEKRYFNHIEERNKINTVEYCLINRAMKNITCKLIVECCQIYIAKVSGGNIYLSLAKTSLILRKLTKDIYVAKKD